MSQVAIEIWASLAVLCMMIAIGYVFIAVIERVWSALQVTYVMIGAAAFCVAMPRIWSALLSFMGGG